MAKDDGLGARQSLEPRSVFVLAVQKIFVQKQPWMKERHVLPHFASVLLSAFVEHAAVLKL
jgi:hypothetical protein